MLSTLLNALRFVDEALTGPPPPSNARPVVCPDAWLDKPTRRVKPPDTKGDKVEHGLVVDTATGQTEWTQVHYAPKGKEIKGSSTLTDYDGGEIVSRFGNQNANQWSRAKDAKGCWHNGTSKAEASKYLMSLGYKASVSLVEKLYAAYSTALDAEKHTKGLQK